jgi:flavin-dependent thymidylate synthase
MKVTLLSCTPDALNLLLGTKNTRMGNGEDPVNQWDEEKKRDHLKYMLGTIKSSWEFVDFVFHIEGVTRAFTQQLERTRAGSYAEQSLRAVDASGFDVKRPDLDEIQGQHWDSTIGQAMDNYRLLVEDGVALQDARGLLPINVLTQITCKFNLRTLSDMSRVRLCTRTQGEYQDVFRAMREAVLAVYPWAEDFLLVECVASGRCAFPNYGPERCPVWQPLLAYKPEDKEHMRQRFWAIRAEANPVAAGGKAK